MTPGAPCDVLIVEDEPSVRECVLRVLAVSGLNVAQAPDVTTALAHPARSSCRVVFCDVKLPDGSGIDVLRELRRTRPDLPFVITTGHATAETLREASEAGATVLLRKPFDAAELVDSISLALQSAPVVKEEGP